MAKKRTALGVEVVGDQVRLALLEDSGAGWTLRSTEMQPASADLSAAYRAMPVRPSAVACAVPLRDAAIRVVQLPPVTGENVDRAVALEAETAMPLPPEELALAHHVLGMTEQSRLEILIAASRLSVVQDTLRKVNTASWVSSQVTLTPVALLNALEPSQRSGGPTAILRVERSGTELIIVEHERVLAAQSLSNGCGPSTNAVLMDGSAEGAQSVPAWVTDLAAEVRYALQAFSYERGVTFQRLWVCGDGARSARELAWALDMAVEPLSPTIGGVAVPAEFAVAYGCALQAAGKAAVTLNLTPARLTMAREVAARQQNRMSYIALAVAVVVALGLGYAAAVHREGQLADLAEADLTKLQQRVNLTTVGDPGELKKAADGVEIALAERVPPTELLQMMNASLPTGAWLAELNYNAGTGCVIRGFALEADGPTRTLAALLMRKIFDEVTLDYRSEEQVSGVPVWGFQLTCRLRAGASPRRRTGR